MKDKGKDNITNPLNKYPKLLHGGDYNPEQWLQYPEILTEDLRLMKKAHVNCVSLGMFSWSTLEPKENNYQIEWLETIINRLYENGIYTILATPTAAMPHWLTQHYPEVMQVKSDRIRNLPGRRHNFCYTSPIMREKTKKINERLSKTLGHHPAVILWHISNELGGNFSDSACHCPLCQQSFREWLKEKYQTLDHLNHAWWSTFWSHTYTDWEQIHSPAPHGENLLHGLNIDWRRFVSSKILDFCQKEIDSIKAYSDNLPVTTNMMHFFQPLDYYKFGKLLDIISWDSYPSWHSEQDDIDIAVCAAANHNIMRSIKKAPFLLMESAPSITNWKPRNILKRPGMHELSSLQAIAHGSNSVQYFQWRKSRGSFEKFHGAVIGHDGTENTRTFREVSKLGDRLEKVSDNISKSINLAEVAIIFDWENWWAIDDATGPMKEMNYVDTILSHYKPFWESGVDVDIIDMDYNIEDYKIVIAPMNYMYKAEYIERVKSYVQNGGTYITTYWSGIVNETDLCFLGNSPLYEVLGIHSEEIDAPNEHYKNSMIFHEKEYKVMDLCEIIRLNGAESIGQYTADYYAGSPSLTKNSYGSGISYYLAAKTEASFLRDFYDSLIETCNVSRNLNTELPYGVTITKRCGEADILFLQNFNNHSVTIALPENYYDIETEETLTGTLLLNSYECRMITKNDIFRNNEM